MVIQDGDGMSEIGMNEVVLALDLLILALLLALFLWCDKRRVRE